MRWVLIPVFLLLAVAATWAWTRLAPANEPGTDQVLRSKLALEKIGVATKMLQSGDLVLRMGSDATSYIFSRFNSVDPTYSHCGIAWIEDGRPVIYHSIGGEDNPDEKLRREEVTQWFSPENNLRFAIVRYPLDSSQLADLHRFLRKKFEDSCRFDMDFDLSTDERMYCAELVY